MGGSSRRIVKNVVAVWGNGDFGRLGVDASKSLTRPSICNLPAALDGDFPIHVACGGAHTVVLTEQGNVYCMGLNDKAQIGTDPIPTPHTAAPVPLPDLPPIKSIAAGHYHSAAICENGRLYVWGSNSHGQVGPRKEHSNASFPPRLLTQLSDHRIVQVALGARHSLALTDEGNVLSWGNSFYGCLGHGLPSIFNRIFNVYREDRPRIIAALIDSEIRSIAAGHHHSACVDSHGSVFMFGYGRDWQLGTGTSNSKYTPVRLPSMERGVESVSCGGSHTAAITRHSSNILTWGSNDHNCLGHSNSEMFARLPTPLRWDLMSPKPPSPPHFAQVACGWKHTAALTESGDLYTWGWGGSVGSHSQENDSTGGQLGHGNEFDYHRPTKVDLSATESTKVVQVSCGFNHTAAIVTEP